MGRIGCRLADAGCGDWGGRYFGRAAINFRIFARDASESDGHASMTDSSSAVTALHFALLPSRDSKISLILAISSSPDRLTSVFVSKSCCWRHLPRQSLVTGCDTK